MNEINHELGIIALESCRELGQQVNKIIQQKRNTEESFLMKYVFQMVKVRLNFQKQLEEKIYIYYAM